MAEMTPERALELVDRERWGGDIGKEIRLFLCLWAAEQERPTCGVVDCARQAGVNHFAAAVEALVCIRRRCLSNRTIDTCEACVLLPHCKEGSVLKAIEEGG